MSPQNPSDEKTGVTRSQLGGWWLVVAVPVASLIVSSVSMYYQKLAVDMQRQAQDDATRRLAGTRTVPDDHLPAETDSLSHGYGWALAQAGVTGLGALVIYLYLRRRYTNALAVANEAHAARLLESGADLHRLREEIAEGHVPVPRRSATAPLLNDQQRITRVRRTFDRHIVKIQEVRTKVARAKELNEQAKSREDWMALPSVMSAAKEAFEEFRIELWNDVHRHIDPASTIYQEFLRDQWMAQWDGAADEWPGRLNVLNHTDALMTAICNTDKLRLHHLAQAA